MLIKNFKIVYLCRFQYLNYALGCFNINVKHDFINFVRLNIYINKGDKAQGTIVICILL